MKNIIKQSLPKAQKGKIVKAITKVIPKSNVVKAKPVIPKIDPRSGKPLSVFQIAKFEKEGKLNFNTVDQQNAKRDLNKAIESRTVKPVRKPTSPANKEAEYQRLLRESYQKKGGIVKSKIKK